MLSNPIILIYISFNIFYAFSLKACFISFLIQKKIFLLEMNVKGIMGDDSARNMKWMVKKTNSDSTTSIGTFSEDSNNSMCSCSSDLTEDADSSSSSHSIGSLCDFSELMNNLPMKYVISSYIFICFIQKNVSSIYLSIY